MLKSETVANVESLAHAAHSKVVNAWSAAVNSAKTISFRQLVFKGLSDARARQAAIVVGLY